MTYGHNSGVAKGGMGACPPIVPGKLGFVSGFWGLRQNPDPSGALPQEPAGGLPPDPLSCFPHSKFLATRRPWVIYSSLFTIQVAKNINKHSDQLKAT